MQYVVAILYLVLTHALLLLHTSVLKPNLHLCFVKCQCRSNLDPSGACQVAIEVEFLLELGQLLVGEVCTSDVAVVAVSRL